MNPSAFGRISFLIWWHMEKFDFQDITAIEITPDIENAFTEARTNIVLGASIYAYAMMRCDYIFTHDIPRAASVVHGDQNLVLLNPDFFMKVLKNSNERAFVIVHEIDHIFFEHHNIMHENGLDVEIFNQATDHFINIGLSGIYIDERGKTQTNARYTKYFTMPVSGIRDLKYTGWDLMRIYEDLLEEKEESDSDNGDGASGGDSAGQDAGFDVMLGDGGSHQQAAKNRQTMQAAVAFAEQTNQIGSEEANLARRIRAMAKPTITWTDRLTAQMQASIRLRPTYNRISRRSAPNDGVIFPTYTGNQINVVFGIDVSGSMGDADFRKIAGEFQGILDQFDAWNVHVVSCDMTLDVVGCFNSVDDSQSINILNMNFRGGGGTNMAPIAEYAKELLDLGERIDAVLVLTDGYIDVHPLDDAMPRDTTNIVVTTRNEIGAMKNAESIHVK